MGMIRSILALSLLAFAVPVFARSAQLIEPDPVAVPAGLGQQQVARDIKRALIGRGWTVTAEQPGQIDSSLHLREHVARIRVDYDAASVRIHYVDSTNLGYRLRHGKPYIHPNYLGWIQYLVNDLSANMQVSAQGG